MEIDRNQRKSSKIYKNNKLNIEFLEKSMKIMKKTTKSIKIYVNKKESQNIDQHDKKTRKSIQITENPQKSNSLKIHEHLLKSMNIY